VPPGTVLAEFLTGFSISQMAGKFGLPFVFISIF
jgi:hypothetical protein